MRFRSLAFRLFATSAAWTLIVLPIAGLIIYSLYREDVQASFDGQLRKLVTAIAIDALEGEATPVAPTNRYEPLFEVPRSGWYWQIKPVDDKGLPTLVSASLADARLPSPYERKFPTDDTGSRWMNVTGPNDQPTRIVELVEPLGGAPGNAKFSVIVAGPLDWLDDIVSKFRYRLSIALTLAGLGLVAVTLFQVRFGLLPLKRVERGLAAIRSGTAERLEGEVPAEIEPLQVEINALLKSNQDVLDRARTQVGNLAHALKTPLAVILNEAHEETTPLAGKVSEQARIMRDSVTLYLDRARMAARVSVIGRSTDVAEVAEPMVRAIERIYRDKGIEIVFAKPAGVMFQGERQDLEELLGNLLDNACKWARSRVYLSMAPLPLVARGPGGEIEIVIEDDGPGLSPEQRSRLGKRGLRLDETKPGSGLGLSIVTEMVQLYRGSIELSGSRYGGLRARVVLPKA